MGSATSDAYAQVVMGFATAAAAKQRKRRRRMAQVKPSGVRQARVSNTVFLMRSHYVIACNLVTDIAKDKEPNC
jgi:hypothetical protein